jgi:hypothetical protein
MNISGWLFEMMLLYAVFMSHEAYVFSLFSYSEYTSCDIPIMRILLFCTFAASSHLSKA